MKHILNRRLHDNHKHGDSECWYFVTVEFEMVHIYLKIHILRGKYYKYLGIYIEFCKNGELRFIMILCIKKIFK